MTAESTEWRGAKPHRKLSSDYEKAEKPQKGRRIPRMA